MVKSTTQSTQKQPNITFDELVTSMIKALKQTLDNDGDILERGRSERSFVSRLACNLQNSFEKEKEGNIKVDAPYNRHSEDIKKIKDKIIESDMVVHERGTDEKNILVIEIETTNHPKGDDLWKLEKMTKVNEEYKYKYGLYLVLGVKNKAGYILKENWYEDGRIKQGKKPISEYDYE